MDTVKLLNSRMIKSFGDKATLDLFHGIALRGTIVSSTKIRKILSQILYPPPINWICWMLPLLLMICVHRPATSLKHCGWLQRFS